MVMMSSDAVDRLRDAVDWVEYQDELPKGEREWNQEQWTPINTVDGGEEDEEFDCGTGFCLAGYVVSQDPLFGGFCSDTTAIVGDDEVDVELQARRMLELKVDDAALLFYGQNTAGQIRSAAENIVGKAL